MSTYKKTTRHPIRKDWQSATWYDDLFGRHRYGVVFPSDEGKIAFDPDKVHLETREDPTP